MFDMDLPWWEFMLRGAIVYIALLVMVRISGKRTVGQFTPFDLLVVMLLSEAVSNSLSGGDSSLTGGLLIAATLIGLNMLVALASSRSRKLSQLVDGTAVLLGRDGKFFDKVVKQARLGQSDLEEALREADCSLEEMQCAFLEAGGEITIMKNPKVKKDDASQPPA
ncbi:hypothetical protein CR105_23870 [Massilia eurypsychrophila]|jgi:uncharacterized membrane protein YcaP (DUF421 family)|uniref:YetF C-terminal domain-containing protein n=1 Tax=Massilia eurypsychrophila TaxID=1485217 RepID=A0A2G8T966_9BURK|nr:YetF domain-containing protein [Massilia eurypsychrophila]PIL42529.1 hypothetical protein CR105_23870 [Massilia eurypsychrophila]